MDEIQQAFLRACRDWIKTANTTKAGEKNPAMHEITCKAMKQQEQYFAGGEEKSAFSQAYWYGLYLNRERIKSLGLQYHVKIQPKDYGITGIREDGKNEIVEDTTSCTITESYEAHGNQVYQDERNVLQEVTIGTALEHDGKVICPNCGSIQTKKQMVDGCDFCGTKYQIDDFNSKVAGMLEKPDEQQVGRESGNRNIGSIGIVYVTLLLSGYLIAALVCKSFVPWIIFFLIYTCILSILAFYAVKKIVKLALSANSIFFLFKNTDRNRMKNTFDDQVVKHDPNFSTTAFISSLSYKLRAIHYANSPRQVEAFCYHNIANMFPNYGDVVQCDIVGYENTGFHVDEQNQVMRNDITAKILRYNNGRMEQYLEKIHIAMIKDKNCKQQLTDDLTLYHCKNCGASVTLLNGGECEYCKSKIDLRKLDWVIADYRVASMTRYEKKKPTKDYIGWCEQHGIL